MHRLQKAVALCWLAVTVRAVAAEEPLWELGLGVAGLSMPDYRGSDERSGYVFPFPYLVYRGTFLQIDREKVRGLFYTGERSEWDISLGATVPVRSDDNSAREGMSDLDPTVEIGPQWSYKLIRNGKEVTLRLPVRRVFAVDFPNFRDVGTVFTPTLAVDWKDEPWPGWKPSVSTGPVFGDKDYVRYFYGVPADEATPTRPAWKAQGGYGGWQLTAALTKRFQDFWIGGFLRGDYLEESVFEDSPLLRREFSWMGGFGVAWVFAKSDEDAP